MLAVCTLARGVLKVDRFECLNGAFRGDFSRFEAWLNTEGEWIAGLDFPFGQSARLIDDLNWPGTWPGYVSHIHRLGKEGFEVVLERYKKEKPAGQKELRRETDVRAGAVSPMKLSGVPIGKMFFQGAARLLHSNLSIHPVRPVNSEKRHIIEAYPALVARRCLGGPMPYKSDDPRRHTEKRRKAREQIVKTLCSDNGGNPFTKAYGFSVEMSCVDKDACIGDPGGDFLDSVLCAIQAAWSGLRRDRDFGIPKEANALEGWICDPGTLERTTETVI